MVLNCTESLYKCCLRATCSFFWVLLLGFLSLADTSLAAPITLDPQFGNRHKVTTDLRSSIDYALAAVRQADGKLVVAGASAFPSGSDGVLVRYHSDGTRDPTFGDDGETYVTSVFRISGLVSQPDGKLVAAARSSTRNQSTLGLLRYDADGQLDTAFGQGGAVFADFTGDIGTVALVKQPDGKLVVVGGVYDWVRSRSDTG